MYALPEDRIATRPLENRSDSKLLIYRNGEIQDRIFKDIVDEMPANALIVRNISKVIPARIIVNSGEVFLTAPVSGDYATELAKTHNSSWSCIVRNAKKTVGNHTLATQLGGVSVNVNKIDDAYQVDFEWETKMAFAEILDAIGQMPLPPYMNRSAENSDSDRYQTVFAEREGSVAAPTASLHFTEEIISQLCSRGCEFADIILHVGLGTFLPMKSLPSEHIMHGERFEVSSKTIHSLYNAYIQGRPIVCIGTTAFRVIESLAWAELWYSPTESVQSVPQWVWRCNNIISPEVSLRILIDTNNSVQGITSLMCMPGYRPQLCSGLITNFHQPDSTLLQLVASFIADDWSRVYQHALDNGYRFLSYGDGSLLWRRTNV